jgi:hypothetical protein
VPTGGRIGLDDELAHRRHHFEQVAGRQLRSRPGGEGASLESLDAYPQVTAVGVGTYRVAATHVDTVDLGPDGDVLTG